VVVEGGARRPARADAAGEAGAFAIMDILAIEAGLLTPPSASSSTP
jgi:hypothetical protein